MDMAEQAQEARKELTVKQKDNLLNQLLACRVAISIHTLKVAMELDGLCRGYPELDDAFNELIHEKKIALHFVRDGEPCFSANH